MGAFFDAALGFPAVLFTVLLVPVVLYWLTALLGGFDIDLAGDAEVDAVVDVGGDVELSDGPVDGADGDGLVAGWWQALGLAEVPFMMAVSLVVVFGWFPALVATGLANGLDVPAPGRLVLGLIVAAGAFVLGVLAASLAARPLARLFATTEAEQRQSFVGRTCVVRTATVTGSFGQAEAADPSGATVLLQVRATESATEDDLHYGEAALIVDYDSAAEVFLVCPVEDVLRDVGA